MICQDETPGGHRYAGCAYAATGGSAFDRGVAGWQGGAPHKKTCGSVWLNGGLNTIPKYILPLVIGRDYTLPVTQYQDPEKKPTVVYRDVTWKFFLECLHWGDFSWRWSWESCPCGIWKESSSANSGVNLYHDHTYLASVFMTSLGWWVENVTRTQFAKSWPPTKEEIFNAQFASITKGTVHCSFGVGFRCHSISKCRIPFLIII